MDTPADQLADWLERVVAALPARLHALYVEYTENAYTQERTRIVWFNAFGFESLANGNYDPLNAHHVNELGEFTWEPEDDCRFQALDYPGVGWMSVLMEAAHAHRVREPLVAKGIQFVIGEHDGITFLVQ